MTKRALLAIGVSLGAISALPFGAAPAAAQGTSATAGDIIVTARRKEETLLQTPLAVSAFGAEEITDAGFVTFDDIFLQAPGVFNSNVTGRSDRVTIRGVSQISTTGGSNAGIFVDGIFVSGPVSSLDVALLERVEIVKGPQSAQFGRGTLAGAVNYVTRRPTDELSAQAIMTAATKDEYSAVGYVSGPITDGLSILVGANYFYQDSLHFNAFENRKDLGGKERFNAMLGLLAKPTENIDIYFRAIYFDQKDDPIALYTQGPEFNNCILNAPRQYYCGVIDIDYDNILSITQAGPGDYPGARGSQGYVGGEAGSDRDAVRLALDMNFNVNDWLISSLTGYQEEDERWGSDATNRGVVSSAFLPNGPAVDISRKWEDFSQELRVRRRFNDMIEVMVGGYYFNSKQTEVATYIPEDRGAVKEDSIAGFGSIELSPNDWITLTGEVRTQRDKITLVSAAGMRRRKPSRRPCRGSPWISRRTRTPCCMVSSPSATSPARSICAPSCRLSCDRSMKKRSRCSRSV